MSVWSSIYTALDKSQIKNLSLCCWCDISYAFRNTFPRNLPIWGKSNTKINPEWPCWWRNETLCNIKTWIFKTCKLCTILLLRKKAQIFKQKFYKRFYNRSGKRTFQCHIWHAVLKWQTHGIVLPQLSKPTYQKIK